MKICFVSPTVGTLTGGSESFIYNIASHLSKKHEILIFTGTFFKSILFKVMKSELAIPSLTVVAEVYAMDQKEKLLL